MGLNKYGKYAAKSTHWDIIRKIRSCNIDWLRGREIFGYGRGFRLIVALWKIAINKIGRFLNLPCR
jgi:hypothetical protein